MKRRVLALITAVCLLTGCTSLLERQYSTSEPHSSKFWESEAAGTLRAENYQDIVNDLLLLIGQHRETATLRLYEFSDDASVMDILERAAVEIQQETPMGAYAVEYITFAYEAQKGYYEAEIKIGYRRTAEQVQAIVNATTPEALYSLLEATLETDRNELAVRIGYWGTDGRERVQTAIEQLRIDRGLEATPGWTVNYYPEEGPVGLVEVLLDVPPPEPEIPEENGEEGVVPENSELQPDGGEPSEETEDAAESGQETPENAEETEEKKESENLEQGA